VDEIFRTYHVREMNKGERKRQEYPKRRAELGEKEREWEGRREKEGRRESGSGRVGGGPVRICMMVEREFFRRRSPACATPIAGIWRNTNAVAKNINEISPWSRRKRRREVIK
jgi:hypothetical protein